jgi:hypothetical protein
MHRVWKTTEFQEKHVDTFSSTTSTYNNNLLPLYTLSNFKKYKTLRNYRLTLMHYSNLMTINLQIGEILTILETNKSNYE